MEKGLSSPHRRGVLGSQIVHAVLTKKDLWVTTTVVTMGARAECHMPAQTKEQEPPSVPGKFCICIVLSRTSS